MCYANLDPGLIGWEADKKGRIPQSRFQERHKDAEGWLVHATVNAASLRCESIPGENERLKAGLGLFSQATGSTLRTAVCSSPALGSMPCCSPPRRWLTGGSTDPSLTAPPAASTGACPISTPRRAPTLWRSSPSATSCPAASSSRLTLAFW